MNELLAPYGPEVIGEMTFAIEPVRYRANGNRATDGTELLRRLEQLVPTLGITRMADISQLAPNRFPVFQTARPNVFLHAALGANTGSQGKGPTVLQAKLSCLMEAVEAYCEEPRSVSYIRGSYDYLREHYPVIDPVSMHSCFATSTARHDEEILWTWAYHVEDGAPLLVPAQSVYCFVLSESYGTRGIFPASSNGLSSGATLLEATVHGLYEVVERMYHGYAESGLAHIDALDETCIQGFDLGVFNESLGGELELQLFPIRLEGVQNLPMILCLLVGDGIAYKGWGCCGDVDTAIFRAVSEAMQTFATHISGSREDMHVPPTQTSRPANHSLLDHLPGRVNLDLARYKDAVLDRTFTSLNEEYTALVSWIHSVGFENICIANLTRRGIEIPVVKVVVPGMPSTRSIEASADVAWTSDAVIRRKYHTETT